MMSALIALAALAAQAAPQQRPAPMPEAAYLVLAPGPAEAPWRGELARSVRSLLVTMHDLGMLRFNPSSVPTSRFAECMTAEPDPRERVEHACFYRRLPDRDGGLPLVTILVEETRSRGSWHELTCSGPGGAAHSQIHLDDGFHQRPDIRRSVREALGRCIAKALAATGAARR